MIFVILYWKSLNYDMNALGIFWWVLGVSINLVKLDEKQITDWLSYFIKRNFKVTLQIPHFILYYLLIIDWELYLITGITIYELG